MSDIVARLRADTAPTTAPRLEAADEIERLNSDLSVAITDADLMNKENKRLREALEEIKSKSAGPGDMNMGPTTSIHRIATAALKGEV